jgi:fimbrial isopeptide formation D2 family protein/LPXTG-motif cell wall-anchored protein
MVKDTTDSDGAQTLYIIKVTGGTMLIEPKGNQPTATKRIVSESGAIDTTAGTKTSALSMGDTIHYAIKGTVSSYVNSYRSYYYKFTDTLSKGLTLDKDSVKIYIDSKDFDVTNYFYKDYKTDSSTGVTTITLAIQDLLELQNLSGGNFKGGKISITPSTVIYVSYDATLNENAFVSSNLTIGTGECTDPNDNKVNVSFSNNPNTSGTELSTEEPSVTPSTSPTPPSDTDTSADDTVYAYTTGLKILKTNSDNEPLTGAVFTLTAVDGQKVNYTNSDASFKKADLSDFADGETKYYKVTLTSDITSYTTIEPTEVDAAHQAKYEKNAAGTAYQLYKKIASTTTTAELTNDNQYSVSATVDASGYVTFTGLGPGKYVLTETTAPIGYNAMSPQTITIEYSQTGFEAKDKTLLPFKVDELNAIQYQASDGMFHWQIQDTAASALPRTGGIGTTIFYVVGSALVLGAVVLLITKKRMSNEVG